MGRKSKNGGVLIALIAILSVLFPVLIDKQGVFEFLGKFVQMRGIKYAIYQPLTDILLNFPARKFAHI
jgi:hypothetical protein